MLRFEVRDLRFEGRNRDNIFNGQIQFEITQNGGALMSQINYSAMSYRGLRLYFQGAGRRSIALH
jgi:hypothetical protein